MAKIRVVNRFPTAFAAVICGAFAATASGGDTDYCTLKTERLLTACQAGVQDDANVGRAICGNINNTKNRNACFADVDESRDEASTLCFDQHDTRLDACGVLGQGRYDPDFSPARFDNPLNPSRPNAYFPLGVGKHWEYRTDTQVDKVDIVNETKLIAGVTCIVARDIVSEGGFTVEATDDWYAAAKDGSVWYFGEEAKDFETFKGDKPVRPQLVSIEGSFKAGVDGAKPGIIALAAPTVHAAYFEEFSLGNAEDVTEILSTTYTYGHDAVLDEGVPRELADRFCNGNCIVTKNYSLLEPGLFAHKYYARGIGTILEVEDGEIVQLVNCNFDQRCANLPVP